MPTKVERAAIRAVALNGLRTLERTIEEVYPIARAKERLAKERDALRFKGNPPAWAKRLTRKYGHRSTELVWRRSRTHTFSSGHCYGGDRVVITAGTSETDQKVVLLHELAHCAVPWDKHGDAFYDELLTLVKAEGLYRAALARHGQGLSLKRAARRARRAAGTRRAMAGGSPPAA
jgi:hypothetical protein